MEQNLFNNPALNQPQAPVPAPGLPEFDIDEHDDPTLVKMGSVVKAMYQQLQTQNKQLEQQQFIGQVRSTHQELATKHEDYDQVAVESRVVAGGSNRFEDTYKAMKLEKIQAGDPEEIKKLIPETVYQGIREETKKDLIAEAKKRAGLRNKSKTPAPKPGVTKQPRGEPTNYQEVKKQALEKIDEAGLNLFK